MEIITILHNELTRVSNHTIRGALKTLINHMWQSPLSSKDSVEDQQLFINDYLHQRVINAETVNAYSGQSTSPEVKALDYISKIVQDAFTKIKLDIINNNPPKVTMEECVDYSLERLT